MLDTRGWRTLYRHRGARVGALLVGALVVFALLGPVAIAHDPNMSDFAAGATESGMPVGPCAAHWLGTDRLFRDELARLAAGARMSLLVAVSSTAIATTLGAAVGLVAGYFQGARGLPLPVVSLAGAAVALGLASTGHKTAAAVVLGATLALGVALRLARPESVLASALYLDADTALMRVVDVLLSFPFLLLVMALGAALDRTSVATILWTLGLTGWLGTARVVRARTLQVKALDFVLAARALGQSSAGIVARHLLPNVAGPLIVIATASVAQMILAESVLSYLGVGIAPPTATWGRMLFEGQDAYLSAPWMLAAPAAAIVVSVFGFNLLGEGLRDALDPRG